MSTLLPPDLFPARIRKCSGCVVTPYVCRRCGASCCEHCCTERLPDGRALCNSCRVREIRVRFFRVGALEISPLPFMLLELGDWLDSLEGRRAPQAVRLAVMARQRDLAEFIISEGF